MTDANRALCRTDPVGVEQELVWEQKIFFVLVLIGFVLVLIGFLIKSGV